MLQSNKATQNTNIPTKLIKVTQILLRKVHEKFVFKQMSEYFE